MLNNGICFMSWDKNSGLLVECDHEGSAFSSYGEQAGESTQLSMKTIRKERAEYKKLSTASAADALHKPNLAAND